MGLWTERHEASPVIFADVQGAIYDRLRADSALDALLARRRRLGGQALQEPAIYDHVPQPQDGGNNAWFPYVTIGEDTFNEWDTDTEKGFDAELMIHCWTRNTGRREVKQIQSAIYNALHQFDLVIPGAHTVLLEHQMAQSLMDPDGKTRHGVQRFRLIAED